MIIDHIYLPVSDLKRSSEFYKKMLEPLGIDMPYINSAARSSVRSGGGASISCSLAPDACRSG